jgi:hypothetical protein
MRQFGSRWTLKPELQFLADTVAKCVDVNVPHYITSDCVAKHHQKDTLCPPRAR